MNVLEGTFNEKKWELVYRFGCWENHPVDGVYVVLLVDNEPTLISKRSVSPVFFSDGNYKEDFAPYIDAVNHKPVDVSKFNSWTYFCDEALWIYEEFSKSDLRVRCEWKLKDCETR